MTDPVPLPNLRDFIGNLEDPFIIYASGSTPASVEAKVRETIGGLTAEDRKGLGLIFILAAVGQRRTLEEALTRPALIPITRYLMEHWSIRGNINFSGLNIGGNIIFAAHARPGPSIMNNWRDKIGDRSIWHTVLDSPRCKLNDKSKQIAKEKVQKFTLEEAMRHGTALIHLLVYGSAAAINPVVNIDGIHTKDFFGVPGSGGQASASHVAQTHVAPDPAIFDNFSPEEFAAMTAEQKKVILEKMKAAATMKAPMVPPKTTPPAPGQELALVAEGVKPKSRMEKPDLRDSTKRRRGLDGKMID